MNVKRIAYSVLAGAGTALLGGVVALAQAPGSGQQPSMPQNPSSPNTTGSQAPGSNPGAYQGAPTSAQDISERAFIIEGAGRRQYGGSAWPARSAEV